MIFLFLVEKIWVSSQIPEYQLGKEYHCHLGVLLIHIDIYLRR